MHEGIEAFRKNTNTVKMSFPLLSCPGERPTAGGVRAGAKQHWVESWPWWPLKESHPPHGCQANPTLLSSHLSSRFRSSSDSRTWPLSFLDSIILCSHLPPIWSGSSTRVGPVCFFFLAALGLRFFLFFFFNFIATLFIYLFTFDCVGSSVRARAFSGYGKWGPLFIAVRGPLFIAVRRPFTIAAPPVEGHRLQTRRLSSCGSRAQLLRGMWDPPRPGLEPVSPALAGRLSTTAPPGKPRSCMF